MELVDQVERKFEESFDINDYEILTDEGWQDCVAIHKTIPYTVWKLTTKSFCLKCADNHIVFDENMNQIFVKDLVVGQKIQTENGLEEVGSVIEFDEVDNMYDIELSENSKHRYYTNGILSHNTTTYTVFCLWLATLFPEQKIMICANKFQTAIEIMNRIRIAYEYLPSFIKPGILVYNKSEISFANQSRICCYSTSSTSSRGSSSNCLIIDEMAFIPKNIMDEFFASVMPVVSSAKNSRVIVVSTPNGTSGLYYDIWVQANSKGAVKNSEGWKAFRIDWFEVPGRDQKWKEKQIVSIGEQRFAQEFGNEFLAGSSNKKLIPDDILDRYKIKLSELQTLDKEFVKGKQQKIINESSDKLYTFTMWHEFDPNKTYLASGDCSEGIGGDTSVLYVWDVTNLSEITMCAKFASNTISLTEFAFITKKILQCYNNPYYICERNGVGGGYLDSLQITYGYQNIVTEGKNNTKGVYSHVSVKSKACLWAREMLTTNGFSFNIYDKELLDEFQTFVKKDTKGIFAVYQALNPAHDDFVMAFIWMCYILQPDIVEKYFICCQTFSSVLDKIYPKILQPIKPYSDQEIKAIYEDELYKDFISFKAEINDKLKDVMSKKDEQEDYNIMKKSRDPYFQDYDNSPSWNSSSYQRPNNGLNPQGQKPQFFII